MSLRLFKPVRAVRLSDVVADQIRQLILQGHIEPGHRLPPERQLAERFGTSRACIREALRQLEQQGIVEIRKGARGGAFVTRVDGESLASSLTLLLKLRRIPIQQVTEARLAIEPVMARRAAQYARPELIEEMAAAVEGMKAHLDSEAEFEHFDDAFHHALGRSQGNPVFEFLAMALLEVIRDAFSGIDYGRENRRRLARSHARVFNAIRRGDSVAAERAMVALIKGANRWLAPFVASAAPPSSSEERGKRLTRRGTRRRR